MASCRRFDPGLASEDTRELTFRLMNEKMFLPDIYRDYQRMLGKYNSVMSECCQPWAMVDDENKLGGVFFVSEVDPEHKGVFYCWIWDPKCYTPATARFMNEYIEHCAQSFGLTRIECRTPDDKKMGKMLEKLFFKLEGRFKGGYKSGGRLHCLYQFRRLFAF